MNRYNGKVLDRTLRMSKIFGAIGMNELFTYKDNIFDSNLFFYCICVLINDYMVIYSSNIFPMSSTSLSCGVV